MTGMIPKEEEERVQRSLFSGDDVIKTVRQNINEPVRLK